MDQRERAELAGAGAPWVCARGRERVRVCRCACVCVPARVHACMHAYIHAYMHTCKHECGHTDTMQVMMAAVEYIMTVQEALPSPRVPARTRLECLLSLSWQSRKRRTERLTQRGRRTEEGEADAEQGGREGGREGEETDTETREMDRVLAGQAARSHPKHIVWLVESKRTGPCCHPRGKRERRVG